MVLDKHKALRKEISEFQAAGYRDLPNTRECWQYSLPVLILFCRSLLLTSAGDRMWGCRVLQSWCAGSRALMLKNSNLIQDSALPVTLFIKTVQRHLLAYPATFRLSSTLCGSFQKKEVKTKWLREWLWSWLGSTATKLWTLPLFTVSQNIRPLELVSKFLRIVVYINNSFIFKKFLFGLNIAPMITNFCFLCGLK